MKRNLILVVATLVAGCGPCRSTKAPEAAAMSDQKEAGAMPAQTPAESPVLVTYSRGGGIAGVQQVLTVRDDGTMSLKDRDRPVRTGAAGAETLARLRDLLASEELRKAPVSAHAKGSDLSTYIITLPDGRGFLTMDAVKNPPVLDEILAIVNELVGECR